MRNQNDNLILSTSSITGSTVRTLSDEKVGSIKDIMLDTETGEVVYAVLSVDTGFLNLESKYFAIPWQAFSFNSHHDDVFVLDVDRERLENSPGFDKDNWPTGPQTEFINEMNTYYGVESTSRFRSSRNTGDIHSESGLGSGTRDSRDSGFGSKETGFGTRETGTTRDSSFGTRDSGMDDSSFESRSRRDADEKGGDWL